MFFESFPVGPFQCNCVILGCEKARSAVVIDPGGEPERILKVLTRHQLKTAYLLHTHAHLDHVGGTSALHQATGSTTGLHEDDMELCENLALQAQLFGLPTPDQPRIDLFLKAGDRLSFGEETIEVLHTPGHTPGSLCFFTEHIGLFTGDTLFSGSIGRTDLWGGSHPALIASIKKELLTFPDDTRVYPGHGAGSTIGREKTLNPFLT